MKRLMLALLVLVLLISVLAVASSEEEDVSLFTGMTLGPYSFYIPQNWYYEIFTTSGDTIQFMFSSGEDMLLPTNFTINIVYNPSNENADTFAENARNNKSDYDSFYSEEIMINGVSAQKITYVNEGPYGPYQLFMLACGTDESTLMIQLHCSPYLSNAGLGFFEYLVSTIEIKS